MKGTISKFFSESDRNVHAEMDWRGGGEKESRLTYQDTDGDGVSGSRNRSEMKKQTKKKSWRKQKQKQKQKTKMKMKTKMKQMQTWLIKVGTAVAQFEWKRQAG